MDRRAPSRRRPRARGRALALLALLGACTGEPAGGPGPDAGHDDAAAALDAAALDTGAPDAGLAPELDAGPGAGPDAGVSTTPDAGHLDGGACAPLGTVDCPIVVDRFPFEAAGRLEDGPASAFDRWACAPDTDEGGPEWVFRVDVPGPGALLVDVEAGPDADPDLHLSAWPPVPGAVCQRAHERLLRVVEAGPLALVVDTWVGGDGRARVGEYRLRVRWLPLPGGPCRLDPRVQRMHWRSCHENAPFDCEDDGSARRLATPAAGPLVREAHLVTVDEPFDEGWPTALRDRIERHYAVSEAATGFVMARREPWAPAGEGGSRWGQGSTGRPVPVEDEAWYVNMHWRDRPPGGTRVLVWDPESGRAVVASGGYETGPGANDAVGGASEEIHAHLGTSHRSPAVMGFLADPSLPLGPIRCE